MPDDATDLESRPGCLPLALRHPVFFLRRLFVAGGLDVALLSLLLGRPQAPSAEPDRETESESDPNENAWGGPADGPDRDE